MEKAMVIGCGAYMDSGYGCPGEWRRLKAASLWKTKPASKLCWGPMIIINPAG